VRRATQIAGWCLVVLIGAHALWLGSLGAFAAQEPHGIAGIGVLVVGVLAIGEVVLGVLVVVSLQLLRLGGGGLPLILWGVTSFVVFVAYASIFGPRSTADLEAVPALGLHPIAAIAALVVVALAVLSRSESARAKSRTGR
jgi:hypothetical protein